MPTIIGPGEEYEKTITPLLAAALLALAGCSNNSGNQLAGIEASLSTSSAMYQHFNLGEFNDVVFEPIVPPKADPLSLQTITGRAGKAD